MQCPIASCSTDMPVLPNLQGVTIRRYSQPKLLSRLKNQQVYPSARHTLHAASSVWDAHSSSASQLFPNTLQNLRVHYRVLTTRHSSLPKPRLSNLPSHPISIRFILISFSVFLDFTICLFASSRLRKILHAFLSPHTSHTPHPCHPPWFITLIIGQWYKARSYSLCNFLQSPFTSSLWPKYLPHHTAFEYVQLCRDQVLHPHKTTGTILLLFVSIFTFVYFKQDGNRFWREWQKTFPEFNLFLISSVYGYITIDCQSLTLLVDSVHGFECQSICITTNCGTKCGRYVVKHNCMNWDVYWL
jgi:hypothetical protein